MIHTPDFIKLMLIEEMVWVDVTPLRWHKVHPLLHRMRLTHLHGLKIYHVKLQLVMLTDFYIVKRRSNDGFHVKKWLQRVYKVDNVTWSICCW